MDLQSDILAILHSALGLPQGAIAADPATPLMGALPELDSMSVVSILLSFEEQYGITIDDDEVGVEAFATVGSLTDFLAARLA